MDTLVGTSISGYTLVRLLGSGGMGAVYLAEDPDIGQQVAIKLVRTDNSDFLDVVSSVAAAERFKQEARAVASLDHLHILPLYRYGEDETSNGKRAYIIMQYRPEGSLWDWLRRRAGLPPGQSFISQTNLPDMNGSWPLSLEEAGEYLQQAASALQYAHERGIIHRDVKPANFLLRIDNGNTVHLLLSDFGLAKLFSSNTATSQILGTPTYMAPEQFNGTAGPESDQYALAVMIYYFLAGCPPFEGDPMRLMHQHLSVDPPSITRINSALPEGIAIVLSRALAKRPADRYPTTEVFAESFSQAVQGTPASLRPLFSLPTLAQTFKAPVSQSDWANSSVPATTLTTPGTSQHPSYAPNSSGSALDSTVYATSAQQDQFSHMPAWPSQSHKPDTTTPDKSRQVSRRKTLGWIAGGAAIVAIGSGTGIYLYSRFAKPAHALYVLRGQSASVTSVSWSPDSTQLVSSSNDSTVRLWLVSNETSTLTYNGHQAAVLSASWSPGGLLIASGGEDNTVQVWDYQGNTKNSFRNLGIVSSVVWVNSGDRLLAGTLGNGLHELFLNTNVATKNTARAFIHALSLSSDGKYLAAALDNGYVAITSLQEIPRRVSLHHIHTEAVHSVAWSQGSTMIASGSVDIAKVWDVATEQVEHVLPHNGTVNGSAWEPNNTGRLATGSTDGSVNIWDVNSSARAIYRGHGGAVMSVSWGLNGLASGAADHNIIIWKV
ncbi:MAG TPA: serine/threonine-protein kinase [Ktedonobacteraceae bacterium]|nr:serine/threonine-protein kinase [Ktedonobacteraceae bacterium]